MKKYLFLILTITLSCDFVYAITVTPSRQLDGAIRTNYRTWNMLPAITSKTLKQVFFVTTSTGTHPAGPYKQCNGIYVLQNRITLGSAYSNQNQGEPRAIRMANGDRIIFGMGGPSGYGTNLIIDYNNKRLEFQDISPYADNYNFEGQSGKNKPQGIFLLPNEKLMLHGSLNYITLTNLQKIYFGQFAESSNSFYYSSALGSVVGEFRNGLMLTESVDTFKLFQEFDPQQGIGYNTVFGGSGEKITGVTLASNGIIYFSDIFTYTNSKTIIRDPLYNLRSIPLDWFDNSLRGQLTTSNKSIIGAIDELNDTKFTNRISTQSNKTVTYLTNIKLTFTPMIAGNYEISSSALVGTASFGAVDIYSKLVLNSTNWQITRDSLSGSASGGYWTGSTKKIIRFLTSTPQYISLQMASSSAANYAFLKESLITIKRIK